VGFSIAHSSQMDFPPVRSRQHLAHSWKRKHNSRPVNHLNDDHYIGLRVERESFGFKVLDRDTPLFPGDTSRNGSQGKEFDRTLTEDPIRATNSDGLIGAGGRENPALLFSEVQGFPPPAVRPERRAAIGEGCFRPWVVFQSGGKEVDLVSDPGGVLCKPTTSMIDLSGFPYSENARIRRDVSYR